MDTPEEIKRWRGAIQAELAKLGKEEMIDNLEISSMMPFEITKKETDQSPAGKLTPTMVGTANQITENLIKYKEAGMTFLYCGRHFLVPRPARRSMIFISLSKKLCRIYS